MEALQAVVLTNAQLRDLLEQAGQRAAELTVSQLRHELTQTPEDLTLKDLRSYLTDPTTILNPRDRWAHNGIIRNIQPTNTNKPKSTAWFMKFQRESGLADCTFRQSPVNGRRKEWTFADIRLAWNAYYRR
ncbi:hypothetical protein JET14_09575 [Martelella lutilitoris]|uniref:Uncharacterized protein n=1 Tax=Martelella lutilitoris TaxID=2583532 RepID=A0A7T7HNF0_9HYPH|nr:hypothetical protein [Martelella lutilitoris]QQM32356.1 hypothetical protein JET14_09575 [Martelella lutilitoris]